MSLIYDKTNWKDDKTTPVNARNLNNMEDGIEYIYHKWDKIIQDSTTGDHAAELIDARYGPNDIEKYTTLGHRLNHMDDKFKNEINSLIFYPRLTGETNDYHRIIRAIQNTKEGGILNIPQGSYYLDGNDIVINKAISIIGQSFDYTMFIGGGIVIESSNVNLEGFTVSCPALDNAFQANTVGVGNIFIKNCKGIARDHSFLFESYFGTVQNVIVDNCISMNSIHGFISKATNITFINCKANNHPNGFGFGVISDNIPGIDKVANAINNSIINCSATVCSSGLRSYVRDKWTTNCVPRCSQNNIEMFTVNKCMNPISIGEDTVPEGYKSIYQVEMFNIQGLREVAKLQDEFTIKLAKTYRCMIDNIISRNGVIQTQNANENIICNVLAQDKTRPHTEARALRESTKFLNTSINNCFEIRLDNSTEDGTVIDFEGLPKSGSIVTIIVRNAGKGNFGGFNSSSCTIDTTKFTIKNSNIPFNQGQVTQWMYTPGISRKWLCIYASDLINLA